jgi:hypothetical protein
MLYFAFGCKTRPLGGEWNPKAVVAVTFSIDDQRFTILRRGPSFSLFDSSGTLLWATSDQGELRTRFSALVSFALPLASQQGENKQARPAFFFLPLFIDQDGSWGSSWQSFDSLGEFKDWQKPTIELMLGIRGSDYWQTYADLSDIKSKIDDFQREKKIVEETRKRLTEKFPKRPWYRDALAFRQELTALETRASKLASEQQQVESDRLDLVSSRDTLKSQMMLIEAALQEHDGDMRFLDERRAQHEIVCPTCGTAHEHSFHARSGGRSRRSTPTTRALRAQTRRSSEATR